MLDDHKPTESNKLLPRCWTAPWTHTEGAAPPVRMRTATAIAHQGTNERHIHKTTVDTAQRTRLASRMPKRRSPRTLRHIRNTPAATIKRHPHRPRAPTRTHGASKKSAATPGMQAMNRPAYYKVQLRDAPTRTGEISLTHTHTQPSQSKHNESMPLRAVVWQGYQRKASHTPQAPPCNRRYASTMRSKLHCCRALRHTTCDAQANCCVTFRPMESSDRLRILLAQEPPCATCRHASQRLVTTITRTKPEHMSPRAHA